MKVLKIILVAILGIVTADVTMIVVYGRPTIFQNADNFPNTDWDTCLQLCYHSQACILAWKNGTNCITFNYTATGPVTQMTSGSIVAFKVNLPNDQCPVGTNPPTFNNMNATGSLYITDLAADNKATWVNYQIYLAGTIWNFAYTYNRSCPDGLVSNLRSDGTIVCFKQWITNDPTGFTYDHAVQLCNNVSGNLAGITYHEDLTYMTSVAQNLRYQVNNSNTYVRIDGIRTTACQATPTTAACKSVNGFTFTDSTVQDFTYYNWTTTSAAQASSNDNCIVLVLNGTNPVKTDVQSCGIDSPLQPLIVICTKPAWIG